MRISAKTGLVAAFTWILFKLCLFFIGVADSTTVIAVLANIFMLLSCISIALYQKKRVDKEETNTLVDVKNGMSAGLPYVLITSIFIYFYYEKINPAYYAHQIAEKEFSIQQMVNDPIKLKKFKSEHPDAEVMTKEQIQSKLIENNKQAGSVSFTSILSTLALLILATFYSLFVTIIFRKLVFKGR